MQVYNAYQTLLKGLASMLHEFHGIPKNSDSIVDKSIGRVESDNDESNVQLTFYVLFFFQEIQSAHFIRTTFISTSWEQSNFQTSYPFISLIVSVYGFFLLYTSFSICQSITSIEILLFIQKIFLY